MTQDYSNAAESPPPNVPTEPPVSESPATESPEATTPAPVKSRPGLPGWLPYFILAVFPALVIGLLVYVFVDGSGSGKDSAPGVVDGFLRLGPSDGEQIDSYKGKLPPGFPTDLPSYPGAKTLVSFLINSSDGASYFVILHTDDSLDKVVKYYEGALDKDPWQVEISRKSSDFSGLRFSRPDNADVQGDVSVHTSDLDKQTSIYVSFQDTNPSSSSTAPKPFQAKASLALPPNFPDVPIYKGKADSIVTDTYLERGGGGGTQYLVSFITKNSQDDVIGFYKDEFKKRGWTVTDSDKAQKFQIAIDFNDGSKSQVSGSIRTDSFDEDQSYTKVDVLVQVMKGGSRGN